jgi:cyclophilin family peptidyl-prolyl cis-trans isomerase
MAQAIHHADDHRTHVLSILGARGLEIPALDVWGYAESAGQMQLDPSKQFSATVHTSRGDFVIALADPKTETVKRFVYLAQDNFYDGLKFRRVVAGDFVQGGDPQGKEQFSVTLAGRASVLAGEHLGHVTSGLDVVEKIQAGDTMTIEITTSR